MNPADRNTPPVRHRITRPALACLVLLALFAPMPAFAYLDPSTGSMVVSAIVGIFASIALAVKTYWYKIKGFFKRGGKRSDGEQSASRESTD